MRSIVSRFAFFYEYVAQKCRSPIMFSFCRYIYDQVQEDRVKKMATILEKTNSAYFPCFRTLFDNVVSSLAEAKEISLYLTPLAKCFKSVEEIDFAEAKPLMASLIHSLGLAWAKCKSYQSSGKLIIMLRQICNLLIQEARRFLDPTSIFQSDVDEALQRVKVSRGSNRSFLDAAFYMQISLAI